MLVVLDRYAPEIKMPLLPRHLQARQRDPSRQATLEDRDRYPALSVLEHFCAWIGQVEQGVSSSSFMRNSSTRASPPDSPRARVSTVDQYPDGTETRLDPRFLLSCRRSAQHSASMTDTAVGIEYRLVDLDDPERPTKLEIV